MLSLRDKFEELRLRLGTGRRLESTGTEPIFYLVFPVCEILDVKRQTKAWRAKLEHDRWHVVTLSLGETVNEIFRNHRLRPVWLTSEKQLIEQAERSTLPRLPRHQQNTREGLSDNSSCSELRAAIDAKLRRSIRSQRLLLITDLEAASIPQNQHDRGIHAGQNPSAGHCSLPRQARRQDEPSIPRILPR